MFQFWMNRWDSNEQVQTVQTVSAVAHGIVFLSKQFEKQIAVGGQSSTLLE